MWNGKASSLQTALWTGVSPKWSGKVSSLQLSLLMSVWMSKHVWAMSAERKCLCGHVGLCRRWQRKEIISVDESACVGYISGKKTSTWIG